MIDVIMHVNGNEVIKLVVDVEDGNPVLSVFEADIDNISAAKKFLKGIVDIYYEEGNFDE